MRLGWGFKSVIRLKPDSALGRGADCTEQVLRMANRNFTKSFSIGGFILGEVYMIAIVFGRSPTNEIIPLSHQLNRMLALAPFCGVFGALIGLGIGLLVTGLLSKR